MLKKEKFDLGQMKELQQVENELIRLEKEILRSWRWYLIYDLCLCFAVGEAEEGLIILEGGLGQFIEMNERITFIKR